MKKIGKKLVSMMLMVGMAAGLMAGCGDKQNSQSSSTVTINDVATREIGGLGLPLCKDKQELSVWFIHSNTVVSDLNEIEGVKKLEENTNVHINWISVDLMEAQEKLGILLSSGEHPDILYYGVNGYPGGIQKGFDDGIIHPDIDKLVRENMPNYMAIINSSEEIRKQAVADNGKFINIKTFVGQDNTIESEGTFSGIAYRKDLLEKLSISEPATVEEWHQALLKAKENGIENPMTLDRDGSSYLSLSWGVGTGGICSWMQMDRDKVISSATLEGFGEYLDTMRQWYEEGLIDPNFTSFNPYMDMPATVENNQTLLYTDCISAFTGGNYYDLRMINNAEAYLQPIVAPALNEGDEPIQFGRRTFTEDGAFISSSCKNPELAAKWLDYLYTEEAINLNFYGIEGLTYELDSDGIPQYTDFIQNNEEGVPATDKLQKYALNVSQGFLGKHVISSSWKITAATTGGNNQELAAVEIWSAPETNIYVPVHLTLTSEENDIVASKQTAINTMVEEYAVNYIIGQTDKSFEYFCAELSQFGLQDVLDVYQAAYDRYLER